MKEKMNWNTKEQLKNLLCDLVSWKSETGTKGEITFPHQLKEKLLELSYFKKNTRYIQLHDAGKERNAVTALYKHQDTSKTIVLISHFDTVHTGEFGALGDLAFQPEALTQKFKEIISELPVDAREDVEKDEYLFGRGTMDMKMGLALHMHLLEIASIEEWPINLLLVTVPDEEVNSSGMRAVVKELLAIQDQFHLDFALFLNSEPSFTQTRNDDKYYIYSGTIGKIMPAALFYGRETHAGEPLDGMNAHYMESFLTREIEFNPAFQEEEFGEKTPLPICLKTYDLKADYSTQTSVHTAALYNVFVMKQNAAEIFNTFHSIVDKAMQQCQDEYEEMCKRENVKPIGKISVTTYEELLEFATNKLGNEKVAEMIQAVTLIHELDEREMAIQISDQLMAHCQELAPTTIIFYAPPYYPAINSSNNPLIKEKISLTKQLLKDNFDVEATQIHYFNGISDLSYVNYDKHDSGWTAYKENIPVWDGVYTIPFKEMQQLDAPVLNIGPFGKDAHKLTERLHKESAFIQTPFVLKEVIKSMF